MKAVKKHLKQTFTPYEQELLQYFYLCIAYDGSKFLVLLIFFSFFHVGREFCMEILFLLSLRNFFGGLHFNHYASCFAFTFAFSSTGLMLSHCIVLCNNLQTALLAVMIMISALIKPVPSADRPPLSAKQNFIYKFCGMIVLFIYFAFFLTTQTFPYRNLCFWVIVLQTLQLTAAKFMKGANRP